MNRVLTGAPAPVSPFPDAVRAVGFRAFVAAMTETVDAGQIYARTVDAIAAALLADHAVVAIPKPDDTDNEGDPLWDLGGNQTVIGYCDIDGHPMVRLPDGEDEAPEWVELYATALLAGARTSRRLATDFAAGGEVRG